MASLGVVAGGDRRRCGSGDPPADTGAGQSCTRRSADLAELGAVELRRQRRGRSGDRRERAAGIFGWAAAIAAVAPASLTFVEGVATEGGMAAFFVGARLFARQIRVGASRLEEAKTEAVQAGIVLAAERRADR